MPDDPVNPGAAPQAGAPTEAAPSGEDSAKGASADILDELIREFSSEKTGESSAAISLSEAGGTGPVASDGPSLAQLRTELEKLRADFDKLQSAEAHLRSEHDRALADLKSVRDQGSKFREAAQREMEAERAMRATVEKARDEIRAELTKTLEELTHHRGSSKVSAELQGHLEEAQRELKEREVSLAALSAREVQMSSELTGARAQVETLTRESMNARSEVEEAQADLAKHQAELERLRAELATAYQDLETAKGAASTPPPPPPTPAASDGGKPVPAAPVAFLGPDGTTVVQQSLFALGKGEALESFLGVLLKQWKGLTFPLVSQVAPEGITISLKGDPEKRSLRILPSGIYLLKLSAAELKGLGTIPRLVSKRPAATPPPT